MEPCSLDGESAACSLEAAGSLDAAGNRSFGVLVAWMLAAMEMMSAQGTLRATLRHTLPTGLPTDPSDILVRHTVEPSLRHTFRHTLPTHPRQPPSDMPSHVHGQSPLSDTSQHIGIHKLQEKDSVGHMGAEAGILHQASRR